VWEFKIPENLNFGLFQFLGFLKTSKNFKPKILLLPALEKLNLRRKKKIAKWIGSLGLLEIVGLEVTTERLFRTATRSQSWRERSKF